MRNTAAVYLYRALLRECRHQLLERFPGVALNIRATLNSAPGSFNANAAPGLQYQLEALEQLVPGLEILPMQLPLSYESLKQLIKDNFIANKSRTDQINPGYSSLDQGFAALRALPQQAYLESCSSSATTDDVTIEATAAFSHKQRPGSEFINPLDQHIFTYRIRITNNRRHPIKVLGRGWVVSNHLGELEGQVQTSPDNAIVGQKPVIQPGGCFEYCSMTPLRVANGPGQMAGKLVVDLYDESGRSDVAQRVNMPVGSFKLQTPQVAGADGSRHKTGR